MDNQHTSIAIDGPGGAGKSTVAKLLARQLGYVYIDTGAMYRACALQALREGIDYADEACLTGMMDRLTFRFIEKDGIQVLTMNGEDVSGEIRTPEVTRGSSLVARSATVRAHLVRMQRRIADESNVVMDGRDIGSHVLPDADLKIFMTASEDVRAQRRYKEMQEKGDTSVSYADVLSDLRQRDLQDETRALSPLVCADDAVVLDTDGMSVAQVAERIRELLTSREEEEDRV